MIPRCLRNGECSIIPYPIISDTYMCRNLFFSLLVLGFQYSSLVPIAFSMKVNLEKKMCRSLSSFCIDGVSIVFKLLGFVSQILWFILNLRGKRFVSLLQTPYTGLSLHSILNRVIRYVLYQILWFGRFVWAEQLQLNGYFQSSFLHFLVFLFLRGYLAIKETYNSWFDSIWPSEHAMHFLISEQWVFLCCIHVIFGHHIHSWFWNSCLKE